MALPLIFKSKTARPSPSPHYARRLDRAQVGAQVIVLEFDRIPADQKALLQAYGLTPGREIRVLQQRPVTVVQIEFTELAFEKEIAEQILVVEAA